MNSDFPSRRKSRQVLIRHRDNIVRIGGDAPIVVQSMTNTDTADIDTTVRQVCALADAGSELVRVTVNTPAAAKAVPHIRERLDQAGCMVPLVGDFHYNGHKLLADEPACAEALSKLRINPGNVGQGEKRDNHFAQLVDMALRFGKPVRIGVNWGSLDQQVLARLLDANQQRLMPLPLPRVMQEALVASALESAQAAETLGLSAERIVLSCKVSEVQELIAVYRTLAQHGDYALHLGLTEAGIGSKGIVASAAALAVLLQEGIGDTIRVSITPEPDVARAEEVRVAQEILQTMGLRAFTPMVTSCPGCGRTTSTFFQQLAARIQHYLREAMSVWRIQYPGVEHMRVAVMGCVVNGPGESKMANIGISLPGTDETPAAPVYVDGEKVATLRGEPIAERFQAMIEDYVRQHYGNAGSEAKNEAKEFSR